MQFKGSVRAPGDKDPGVRVVLDIDEYHLEIRRDSELIGRYYLADVEVARDIAERFILFLGEDEVEFMADDALQFAYGGVTAMQDGWLSAQKRKRRHRRAAEEAARRKDGERPIEAEAPVAGPMYVSDSDTIRSRRRQVAGKSPETAAPERTSTAKKAAPIRQAPPEKRAGRIESKKAAANASLPVEPPESVAPVAVDPPVAPVPVERGPLQRVPLERPVEGGPVAGGPLERPVAGGPQTPEPKEVPEKPAAARVRRSREVKDPIAARASSPKDHAPVQEPSRAAAAVETVPAVGEPEPVVDTLAARRKKITADAKPKGRDDLGRVRVPEPVSGTAARASRTEASATLVEPTRAKTEVDSEDVRFAQEGHHPSETSTGLLSRLRRQPKLPTDHVHKFKESGSSVGLVRRVCIECAHVSIGSEDD